MNIKDYILWLEDETKEIKKLINENEKLNVEQLEEIQCNLENIKRIEKNLSEIIEKKINENEE